MSRLSQFFCFLEEEALPTAEQLRVRYTAIEITDEIRKLRTEYQRNKKKHKQTKIDFGTVNGG
jgi:hypothetical protein